jgi:AmmeMemoRadiSam system protein A
VTPVQQARPLLTEEQKQALLALARTAVEAQVSGAPPPSLLINTMPPLPDAMGAFVTIKANGELRGCLGTLNCPPGQLPSEVARCGADAASHDPRFAPVSAGELRELSIEVSVLGPLEPIDPPDPSEVVVGRHGLVVEQGHRRGLLLPQVAPEWGWTAEEFLQQSCLKAGLRPDAWRRGARVYRFEADVFGER